MYNSYSLPTIINPSRMRPPYTVLYLIVLCVTKYLVTHTYFIAGPKIANVVYAPEG